jgi:hypothetical protein
MASDNPIPNIEISHQFDTIEEAKAAIQEHGRQNGYGMVTHQSRLTKDKSKVKQLILQCDRHTTPNPSVSAGLQEKGSRQRGYPYTIQLQLHPRDTYKIEMQGNHDHLPSLDPSAHPVHRRQALSIATRRSTSLSIGFTSDLTSLPTSTVKTLHKAGVNPRQIMAQVITKHPGILLLLLSR